jgi:hypothetical protein
VGCARAKHKQALLSARAKHKQALLSARAKHKQALLSARAKHKQALLSARAKRKQARHDRVSGRVGEGKGAGSKEAPAMIPTSDPHGLGPLSTAERICLSRARSLLAQADRLPLPLAAAYRRRAEELELEAHLIHEAAA